MSSSAFANITSLHYLDVTRGQHARHTALHVAPQRDEPSSSSPAAPPGVPEEEVQARIAEARRAERHATEQRLNSEHTLQETALRAHITEALDTFSGERSGYFARVEAEIVHLALAIARKILQREAQLDPVLLAGLVHVALDGLQSGPGVRLRVAPDRVTAWQDHALRSPGHRLADVVPDPTLSVDECVLETPVGTAQLSYEIQLKEIEGGFLDLLGQRPDRMTQVAPQLEARTRDGAA